MRISGNQVGQSIVSGGGAFRGPCCSAGAVRRARLWAEQEMRPFVDLIIRVRSTEQPSYLLVSGELQQVDDGLSESAAAIVRECEGRIAEIRAEAARMASLAHRSTGLCGRSFQDRVRVRKRSE